jgi:hypothetical protein
MMESLINLIVCNPFGTDATIRKTSMFPPPLGGLNLWVTQRRYRKKIMAMAKAPTKPQRSANKAQGST